MSRPRLIRYLLVATVIAVLLWTALRPQAQPVDHAIIGRGDVIDSIEAEGQTRVRDRYVIHAPIAAQARRQTLQPGDAVIAGQVVAVLDPLPAVALDPRSRAEAEARALAADAQWHAIAEQVKAAESAARQAEAEARRLRTLASQGLISIEQAEQAETAHLQAERQVAGLRFQWATAEHQRDAARAVLQFGSTAASSESALTLTSPIEGTVLRRHIESATPVQAGTALLEIGDPEQLEVAVDVLSADAVRLRAEMPVVLMRWGEPDPLQGRVRRIEPAGFTKFSALGVEEQRVWVIVDLISPEQQWRSLGDGFRVDARFELQRRQNVIRLPASALFRHADGWAAFAIVDARAQLRLVEVGLRGGVWVEVIAGLAEGERVVIHPDRELADGARVRSR